MLEKDSRPLGAVLALDIGGANLKAADGRGFALSRFFPLWQTPQGLADAIGDLIASSPQAQTLVATMTGELADCFSTKADGVRAIVAALAQAVGPRALRIYFTDGAFAEPLLAVERPLLAAASNWHALARFAARFVEGNLGLLIDIGSTTCDIIPIIEGRPAACGQTDPERLVSGELVYTGVERSPVCAVVDALPWREQSCPVAQELFATTRDAYLMLGPLPEDPTDTHTADGRPATRAAAHDRLARSICADRTMFDEADARRAASAVFESQCQLIATAVEKVVDRLPSPARQRLTAIVSGQGEFLARQVVERALPDCTVVSMNDKLGTEISRVAPAHALAVLARESLGPIR